MSGAWVLHNHNGELNHFFSFNCQRVASGYMCVWRRGRVGMSGEELPWLRNGMPAGWLIKVLLRLQAAKFMCLDNCFNGQRMKNQDSTSQHSKGKKILVWRKTQSLTCPTVCGTFQAVWHSHVTSWGSHLISLILVLLCTDKCVDLNQDLQKKILEVCVPLPALQPH